MATATPREGKLTDSDYDARNSTLAQSMRRTCSRSVVVVLPITVGIAVASGGVAGLSVSGVRPVALVGGGLFLNKDSNNRLRKR